MTTRCLTVSTTADVTLNGQSLGQHEGYFQRFSLDATGALQRHNQLIIRVDSPFEDPQTVWPLHKTAMKGILNQHDTRPCGAWSPEGQDANSGGIWAPVRLHLSRGATIDDIILRPDWTQGLTHPALKAEIRYRALQSERATVRLTATPPTSTANALRLTFRSPSKATPIPCRLRCP